MSIIQKAIQHNKQRPVKNAHIDPETDKKLISGCYGIDNLFVDKSKKLSFVEFWSGLKDIFLGCLIFIPKVLSAIFSIIKRPGYALGISCTLILALFMSFTHSTPKQVQNVTAVHNSKLVPLSEARDKNSGPISEKIIDNSEGKNEVKKAELGSSVVPGTSHLGQNNVEGTNFSQSLEAKVRNFFAEHKISDIMCKDGHCLLKIDNNVFRERSTLCTFPKIVMESSTDDELVFSDGAENYCTIKIEDLFQ